MPCIHPSESPPLGWLVPCLAVGDIAASLAWYGRLGLAAYGGEPSKGWAMLRSRAAEIHLFQGHIPRDLLNFRGGDVPAIRRALEGRGLAVATVHGPWSVIFRDPDGREVFFDSSPEERAAYETGQFLTAPVAGNDVHAGEGPDLGNLSWCLACGDVGATRAYYGTLGMAAAGGGPGAGPIVVGRVDHPVRPGVRSATTVLSLHGSGIPRDTLRFQGGDVAAVAAAIGGRAARTPDGGESLLLADPDGRPVLLETTPAERLYRG